jgi:hypothetical protein
MILILNIFVTKEFKANKERDENKKLCNNIKNDVDNQEDSVINCKLTIKFFELLLQSYPSERDC